MPKARTDSSPPVSHVRYVQQVFKNLPEYQQFVNSSAGFQYPNFHRHALLKSLGSPLSQPRNAQDFAVAYSAETLLRAAMPPETKLLEAGLQEIAAAGSKKKVVQAPHYKILTELKKNAQPRIDCSTPRTQVMYEESIGKRPPSTEPTSLRRSASQPDPFTHSAQLQASRKDAITAYEQLWKPGSSMPPPGRRSAPEQQRPHHLEALQEEPQDSAESSQLPFRDSLQWEEKALFDSMAMFLSTLSPSMRSVALEELQHAAASGVMQKHY